jgi:hypothetical protein
MEVSGQLHAPAALPPGKDTLAGTHWTGGWVGPRAVLNTVEKRKVRSLRLNRTPEPGIFISSELLK